MALMGAAGKPLRRSKPHSFRCKANLPSRVPRQAKCHRPTWRPDKGKASSSGGKKRSLVGSFRVGGGGAQRSRAAQEPTLRGSPAVPTRAAWFCGRLPWGSLVLPTPWTAQGRWGGIAHGGRSESTR